MSDMACPNLETECSPPLKTDSPRPACSNCLHFMSTEDEYCMLVYCRMDFFEIEKTTSVERVVLFQLAESCPEYVLDVPF